MVLEFIFVDESGVLTKDPHQPYFSIGFIKIKSTAHIYQHLTALKSRAMSHIITSGEKRGFEFKFNMVKGGNLFLYQELVEIFCDCQDVEYSCFIVDKKHPQFDLEKHFPTHWDAYISFSKLHLKLVCGKKDSVVVIADSVSKPKASTKFYEKEICRLPAVKNAVLMESHASLLVQLTDVITGCVLGNLKGVKGNKKALADYLLMRYGVNDWSSNISLSNPNKFRVWHFIPK